MESVAPCPYPACEGEGVTEAQISLAITRLLRSLGGAVWSTEQGYRKGRGGTRTTAGIPDLIVIFPRAWTFAEIKTQKGKLRTAQKFFRDECREAGVPWELWRSAADAWNWCVRSGVVSGSLTLEQIT